MQKGQASAEVLSLIGISLLVVLIFFSLALSILSGIELQKNHNDARDSVQALAEAADHVYAQGEGAIRRVNIRIPPNANLSANSSFIGRPANDVQDADPKTVNINVGGTDVMATASARLSGFFPNVTGLHAMKAVSMGSYVRIRPYVAEVDRQSVFVSMAKGETRSVTVRVFSVADSQASAQLLATWAYPDVGLSVTPQSFNAVPNGTPIILTFNASPSASGVHNALLAINATGGRGGANEMIYIPLSVDVR